jgi:hypothetical protein
MHKGFQEKQLDGFLFFLFPLLFHHGRHLGMARAFILKEN